MMRKLCGTAFAVCCLAAPATFADTLVAARTLRAGTVLQAEDIAAAGDDATGDADPTPLIGLETRVAVYAGRPLRKEDLGPPTMIARNQPVTLAYHRGGLIIRTEGRALQQGVSAMWCA